MKDRRTTTFRPIKSMSLRDMMRATEARVNPESAAASHRMPVGPSPVKE